MPCLLSNKVDISTRRTYGWNHQSCCIVSHEPTTIYVLEPHRQREDEPRKESCLARTTPNCFFFPECVARVPVSFGGLGVRLCSRKVVSMFATVRERSQPSACPP